MSANSPPPVVVVPVSEYMGEGGVLPSERGTEYPNHPPTSERVGWLLAEFNVRSLDTSQREAFVTRALAAGITSEDVDVLHWWFSDFEKRHGPTHAGGYVATVMASAEAWRSVLDGAETAYARAHSVASKPYPNHVYQDNDAIPYTVADWEHDVYSYYQYDCYPKKDVERTAEEFCTTPERVEAIVKTHSGAAS